MEKLLNEYLTEKWKVAMAENGVEVINAAPPIEINYLQMVWTAQFWKAAYTNAAKIQEPCMN